jgi:pilus assembly protein CpaB
MKDHNPTGSFPTPGFTTGSYARPGMPGRGSGGRRPSKAKGYLFFLFALIFAGTAGYLVFQTLQSASEGQKPLPTVAVVIAAQDIPLGTTLTPEHIKVTQWPLESAPPARFERVEDVLGRVAKVDLFQNEMIHETRLAPIEAGSGLIALIPRGMRAISIRVTEESGVSGFIKPGDFIDVVTILRLQGGEMEARTTLQNIKVLAVGENYQNSEESRGKPIRVPMVTVVVTPSQGEQLALATTTGQIVLTLRNGYDIEMPLSSGYSVTKIVAVPGAAPGEFATPNNLSLPPEKKDDEEKKPSKEKKPKEEPKPEEPKEPTEPGLPTIIKGEKKITPKR